MRQRITWAAPDSGRGARAIAAWPAVAAGPVVAGPVAAGPVAAGPGGAVRHALRGAFRAALLGGTAAVALATAARAEEGRPVPAGTWLAARAAWAAHDYEAAAPLLAEALDAAPDDLPLLERAATAALAQGDIDEALALAGRIEGRGAASLPARLALAADRAAREDWDGLLADLSGGRGTGPLLDGLLRGWALVGRGEGEAALAAFDALAAEPGLAALALTHRAHAQAALGDLDGAAATLALGPEEGMRRSRRGVMAQALALAGLGRGDEAGALLAEAFGPAPDAAVAALRDRLAGGDGAAPLVPDARAGVAEALLDVARALPEADSAQASLLHARAALAVDPAQAEGAILAAERLRALGQGALAARAYALVDPADPAFVAAEMGRAGVLRAEGEAAAAAEVLAALARRHPDLAEVALAEGDQLRLDGRFEAAEAAYTRAIALQESGAPAALWRAHYARAVARDARGDWPGSEADLRRALALSPGQPQILNRLGYALVDRGLALDEALGLIEAAVAAEPEDGFIVDSLGWALFRMGRTREAVEALERAAALRPGDAVINDHLGDAYWQAGRIREARFQWSRALSFAPGDAAAERIRLKLARGLEAAPPPQPVPEAAARPGGEAQDG